MTVTSLTSLQPEKIVRNLSVGAAWAWMDITTKYRRSVIGPFWETINVFVLVISMTYISYILFGNSPYAILPYVGLGVLTWSAIIAFVTEGTRAFINNRDSIKTSPFSVDLYVGRTVFMVAIIICHYFVLYFIGLPFLDMPIGWLNFASLIGLVAILINAFWVTPVLGFLCARFRDLEMIVRNFMQIAFFLTPIFWDYRQVAATRAYLVDYNPFFYFLEAVRAPLLGQQLPMSHYLVIAGITIFGYATLAVVYMRFRRDLSFYV